MSEPIATADRTEPRTSMLVMATLYSDGGSAPVKIRDLSPMGALIEGGVIPAPSTRISLVRGSLTIVGEVVWREGGRAGLTFASKVKVADWLPKGRSRAPQQRVDEVVQQFKAAPTWSSVAAEPKARMIDAVELAHAKKMIESLAEDLADDPELLARHGAKLQALDLAAQLFGKLAANNI